MFLRRHPCVYPPVPVLIKAITRDVQHAQKPEADGTTREASYYRVYTEGKTLEDSVDVANEPRRRVLVFQNSPRPLAWLPDLGPRIGDDELHVFKRAQAEKQM